MLKLTDEQKKMYDGVYGRGTQKAMTMLVEYGNAFGAKRLIKVDSVHTFNSDHPDYLSQMLDGVDEVRTFCSLHAMIPAATRWARALGIRADVVEREAKLQEERVKIFKKVGFLETYTCVPYLVGNALNKGMVYSWPGSSGIAIGNSLYGARGNRDAGPAALSSAITGFTPEMMLNIPKNRYAELVVRLEGLDVAKFTAADFGALGYYIGSAAGQRKVALVGVPAPQPFENMKYLFSPMPVSGAVSLCHVVGVTPEAPTLKAALGDGKPEDTIRVGKKELEEGYRRLNTAKTNQVDAVCLGCPHLTISELKKVARLLDGKKVKEGVRFWAATADSIHTLAKRMGFVDIIEKAGGLVITDTCVMNFPFPALEKPVKNSATNSARAGHYQARGGAAGGVGVGVLYGTTEQCVAAAIKGRWGG